MIEAKTRAELESKTGYVFRNAELLENALTHSSYANEQGEEGIKSNERLEFLGDAVTGLEAALLIFEKGPDLNEGQMTAVRASIVNSEGLASAARSIGLGRLIRLGVGAEKTGVRENEAVLENAFEALVAAVYLDGGTEAARSMVRKLLTAETEEKIRGIPGSVSDTDYKSLLQEALQKNGAAKIAYVLRDESGAEHDKTFRVSVLCEDRELGEGEGKTKKHAEKMAAKMALEELRCI